MYHRIADESFDPWGMAVSADHFTEQMDWLARNRTVMPLSEFASAHRQRRLPIDAVAITFDDGYACTFATAAPILVRHDLPASVFVPPASIGKGKEFWWDELEHLVLSFEGSSLALEGEQVGLGPRSERDRRWRPFDAPRTPRQKAFRNLWRKIHRKATREVDVAMGSLRTQTGMAPTHRTSHRIADADILKSSHLSIGCHGLSHASLPSLGPADQMREISQARELLTELTGKQPTTFAYPFGDLDAPARDRVARSGFLCACASAQRFVGPRADPFALPRLQVENVDAQSLERMLSGR